MLSPYLAVISNAGLKACDVEKLLSEARKIVSHFKLPAIQSGLLKEAGGSKLAQDVPTRWGSTLIMIRQLLANKTHVLDVLRSHQHSLVLLTDAEWKKSAKVAKLLGPCEEATTLLGGESMSQVQQFYPS